MDQVVLGRTGLSVSVACLGAGGHSRLGMGTGKSTAESVALVRAALDLGVSIIDTASVYGTEAIVGEALTGRRDQVVLSTKASSAVRGEVPDADRGVTPAELRRSVEESLVRLRTDYVDILHLHAVSASHYDHCAAALMPELDRLRAEGKVRFFGITERFNSDTAHQMLGRATNDGAWDVVMAGYNIFNQTAATRIFQNTMARGIGTMCMFAVRWGLIDATRATALIDELAEGGEVDRAAFDADHPFGFLVEDGRPIPLTEAAYRFCRHSPGVDVVMTGTGDRRHLEDNLEAIGMAPLPGAVTRRLQQLFGRVTSATGDAPAKVG